MDKTNKDKDFSDLIESLKTKFGEGSIMRLGDKKIGKTEVIPSGSFSLDLALGVGGLPCGRMVEIYGPEMSGKSTLTLHAIAELQKKGGKAAYIDAEHAFDIDYARKLGVKTDDLLLSQPDSGEEALNIVESLVRSGIIDLIVVDSVAALTPRAEIEGEMGDQFMGLQARMMGQALRKLTAITSKSKTVIIFINQIRMKIGIMFGNPETTPGGRALKFFSSIRIDIRAKAKLKKGEEIIGQLVHAKVVKNKVAAPFKIAEFEIIFGEGIVPEADVLNTAIKYGSVIKSGNTYSFNKEKLGVGLEAAKLKLKEDKKLLEEIKKQTLTAAQTPAKV
ncbi:MAG: recombinase RecA [bacterium]|nr:recombinase RecA [bacterium]